MFQLDADSVFNFVESNTQYIDIGTNNSVLMPTDEMSISLWVKFSSAAMGNTRGLFSANSASGYNGYVIWKDNNNKIAFLINDGSWKSATRTTAVVQDIWYHVVGTWDGSTARIYVDNVDEANVSVSSIVYNASTVNRIGDYANDEMDGNMANVQFWNKELSASEVTTLYNSGVPLLTGTQPQEANLKAWWQLNQSANWEADTAGEWQIPDNRSAYPQSFNFNGSSDVINISNSPIFNLGTAFTISGWFNFNYTNATKGLISFDSSSTRGWFLYTLSGNEIRIFDGTSVFTLKTSYTTTNQWDNFIVTYDGTDLVFYINGVQQSTQAVSVDLQTNGNDGQIGNNQFLTGRYFNGKMSNIAIWNSDQTSEKDNIYNNGVPATSYTNNPIAWYKLNDNEIWDGTNWNVENQKYPANWDSALSFDGAIGGALINVGNDSSLNITDSLSVSAWFKTLNNSSTIMIATKDNGGASRAWQLYMHSTGTVRFGINGVTGLATSSGVYDDGNWHHVVALYEPSNYVKLYIDGVADGEDTSSVPSSINDLPSQDVVIGAYSVYDGAGGRRWDGELSNIAVYNASLDTAAISTLYNNGTPETSISSSPISWWKLNNLTTGIQDSVGSNDGTNNGATKVNTFVSTETGISSGMTEQNLVNNNVSALNGESVGMDTTNLVISDLTKKQPFSSYSINFDYAGGDYLQTTAGSNSILSGATSCTISAWVNISDLSSGLGLRPFAQNWDNISASYNYILRYYQSQFQFYIHANGSTGSATYAFTPTLDTWYHVLGTWVGGTIQLYFNGAAVGTPGTRTGTIPTITTSDKIGYYKSGSTEYFMDGAISNVAIWKNTALGLDDILNIYNNGVPQSLSSFRITPTAWFPIDQSYTYFNGSVLVARDVISGNDATGVNLIQENIVGTAPGSTGNGTGTNLTIADLKGNMSSSSHNSYSINMADYADGVTNPANSGRSTSVPG